MNQRIQDFWRALDERQKAAEIQAENHERALQIARAAMDQRLEGMNEFREQLHRQAATFITRAVLDTMSERWDVQFAQQLRELGDLRQRQAQMISYVLGAAALAAVVAGMIDVVVRVWLK